VISPQEIEVSHQSTDDGEGSIGALQKNRMGTSSESHQRRDHPLATIQRIGSVQFTHFGDLLQKETEQDSRAFSGGNQDQANEVNSKQAVALSKMKRKKVLIRS
jgi:hypothetical protein